MRALKAQTRPKFLRLFSLLALLVRVSECFFRTFSSRYFFEVDGNSTMMCTNPHGIFSTIQKFSFSTKLQQKMEYFTDPCEEFEFVDLLVDDFLSSSSLLSHIH